MPAYRSAGGLDDPILSDGDRGFIGMNQRLQRNQLQEGEVWLSKNGRIEGYWQGRKGITLRTGALDDGSQPLLLPFYLVGTSPSYQRAITIAERDQNKVRITFGSAHGYPAGSSGWVALGDVDNPTNYPLTGDAYPDDVPGGLYYMTVDTPTRLVFDQTGPDDALIVDATYGYITSPELDDTASSTILGSCVYSDPNSTHDEYIILALERVAKKVSLSDFTVTDLDYPSNIPAAGITGPIDMIQAFGCVVIFREGQQCLTWKPNGAPIISASRSTVTVTVKVQNHGFLTGDSVVISNLTYVTTDPNGTYLIASVTDKDTFTYTLGAGAGTETYTVTDYSNALCNQFTLGPAGPFTQPQTFVVASNTAGFTVSNGLASIPVTSNTTIFKGDFVNIYETTIPEFSAVVGRRFEVVAATTTQIQFYAPVGNFSPGGSNQIEFGGNFSIGGGFIHPPGAPWGVYFQRRMWLPYWYEPNGTFSSPNYIDRKVRDQIVASDILDPATYDQIASQFRITAGIADYTVAMQPFYDDALMVLNRNSLHLVAGTQGSLADTVVKELTREVGCLARKSVATQGNAVFFLSDNGVYGVEFIEQYNLRGVQEPLSKPIQPYIDRINESLASNAIGIYFNNRYFLAVPLDSQRGAGDAVGNNTVLIFNLLNKAWESVDNYGTSNFNIINFHIGQADERNNLYIVNEFGGVHEADANETPIDTISTSVVGDSYTENVDYKLESRGYDLDTLERKRFTMAQVQVQANNDSCNLNFGFSSEDPDSDSVQIGSINSLVGTDIGPNESANLRMRLGGYRGYLGTLTISADLSGSQPSGRAKVNSIVLNGTVTNRQTISQY